jgi:hypothetical protein
MLTKTESAVALVGAVPVAVICVQPVVVLVTKLPETSEIMLPPVRAVHHRKVTRVDRATVAALVLITAVYG